MIGKINFISLTVSQDQSPFGLDLMYTSIWGKGIVTLFWMNFLIIILLISLFTLLILKIFLLKNRIWKSSDEFPKLTNLASTRSFSKISECSKALSSRILRTKSTSLPYETPTSILKRSFLCLVAPVYYFICSDLKNLEL